MCETERNKEGHTSVYLKARNRARVTVKQRLCQALRDSGKGMVDHTASKQRAKAYSLDLYRVVFVLFCFRFYIHG